MGAIPRASATRQRRESREKKGHARIRPRAQQHHTNRECQCGCKTGPPPGPRIFVPGMGHRHACARIFRSWVHRGEKRIESSFNREGSLGKSGRRQQVGASCEASVAQSDLEGLQMISARCRSRA